MAEDPAYIKTLGARPACCGSTVSGASFHPSKSLLAPLTTGTFIPARW